MIWQSRKVFGAWILWHCKLDDGKIYRSNHSGSLRKSEMSRPNCSPVYQQIATALHDIDFSSVRVREYPLLLFWTICVILKLTERGTGWDACDKNDMLCGEVILDSAMPAATKYGNFALLGEPKDGFSSLLLQWNDGLQSGTAIATCLQTFWMSL
jgi:hypothetical protein